MGDLSGVLPDDFMSIRLTVIPALHTLQLNCNANELYKAWVASKPWPFIINEPTKLVVWRHQLQVWRMELTEADSAFLESLSCGHSLGASLDCVLQAFEVTEEQLFQSFQTWVNEGFFSHYRSNPEDL
jgi:hypothetical protein